MHNVVSWFTKSRSHRMNMLSPHAYLDAETMHEMATHFAHNRSLDLEKLRVSFWMDRLNECESD